MGMKVQEVTPGSAAGLAGLRPPHCAPRPSPGLARPPAGSHQVTGPGVTSSSQPGWSHLRLQRQLLRGHPERLEPRENSPVTAEQQRHHLPQVRFMEDEHGRKG